MWIYTYSNELTHHGIKGQKWGVRRDRKNTNAVVERTKKEAGTEDEVRRHKKLVKAGAIFAASITSGVVGGLTVNELLKKTDIHSAARYTMSLGIMALTATGWAEILSNRFLNDD